jgi:tetratricopeptide (TPR) repeat protein
MEPRVVDALNTAREAVESAPDSADAWGRYGIVLDAHDLDVHAEACYRAARKLDPTEYRWAYFLGRTREILGQHPDSVYAPLAAAMALKPVYVPGLIRTGDTLSRAGRHEDARAMYERALELDPESARAHRGLGLSLLSLDDPEGALGHIERAAELDSTDGNNFAALARARARTGNRSGAREAQAKARDLPRIKAYPDSILAEVAWAGISSDACARRAKDSMDQGRFRQAVRDLQIALETKSDEPGLHVRLGTSFAFLRQIDPAIRHFQRALELEEAQADSHLELGNLLMVKARIDEAIRHFRRSEELTEGKDPAPVAKLASALAQRGDLDSALVEFTRASGLGPLPATDHLNWGTALAQSGDPAKAALRFEEAIRLAPLSANAHFNLGVALEDLGRREEAIASYRRAVAIEPNHPAKIRLAALGVPLSEESEER